MSVSVILKHRLNCFVNLKWQLILVNLVTAKVNLDISMYKNLIVTHFHVYLET